MESSSTSSINQHRTEMLYLHYIATQTKNWTLDTGHGGVLSWNPTPAPRKENRKMSIAVTFLNRRLPWVMLLVWAFAATDCKEYKEYHIQQCLLGSGKSGSICPTTGTQRRKARMVSGHWNAHRVRAVWESKRLIVPAQATCNLPTLSTLHQIAPPSIPSFSIAIH